MPTSPSLAWIIYYEDGTTFSSEDGSFKDAPAWGVIGVGCDPDLFHGVDFTGLLDYLARTGLVKFGRLTSNENYDKIMKRARADPRLSPNRHIYEQTDFYVWMEPVNDD